MAKPIYLDNNATTPLDPEVFEAMRPVLLEHFGNPASTTHTFGWYAAELVQQAREETAALIGAAAEEIVFTSGATESNNLAIKGVAAAKGSGKIISVATEHKSVLDPLHHLQQQGFGVEILPVDRAGQLSLEQLEAALGPETILVSVMYANNEIGTLHDIAAIGNICSNRGVLFHCDATQAAGRCAIDVKLLNADLLSLTAHKMYGPKGTGALYVRCGIGASDLVPEIYGGGHERGFRSGTLNVAGIVGMGRAAKLARERGTEDTARSSKLASELLARLRAGIPDLHLVGPPIGPENRLPGNLNLRIDGVDNARLVGLVQTKLALSVSSACQSAQARPSHVLAALGLTESEQRSCFRLGIGRFTIESEIERAADILISAAGKAR